MQIPFSVIRRRIRMSHMLELRPVVARIVVYELEIVVGATLPFSCVSTRDTDFKRSAHSAVPYR